MTTITTTTTYKRKRVPVCSGSGTRTNAFPGQDVCPVCETWQRVREDSTFGTHRRLPKRRRAEDFR